MKVGESLGDFLRVFWISSEHNYFLKFLWRSFFIGDDSINSLSLITE